jgi:hypothetical protein
MLPEGIRVDKRNKQELCQLCNNMVTVQEKSVSGVASEYMVRQ